MSERLFIIIPAYNAEKTVESVFARMPAEVDRLVSHYVVVNDGSTDGTAERLAHLQTKQERLVVLQHDANRGYGAAEKTLLDYALSEGADVAAMVHADGQYSPEKLPDILQAFTKLGADVVQGSRLLGGGALRGGMPLYKYVANRALTGLENRAFGMKMAEYHSGYMAYARSFLEAVPFHKLSDSFDFDLEMLVAAKVLDREIVEVPIPTIYADEVSHLNPFRYGMDVLAVVKRYRSGYYHDLLSAWNKEEGSAS